MGDLVDPTAVMMTNDFICDLSSQRIRELWNSCAAISDASTFAPTGGRERWQEAAYIFPGQDAQISSSRNAR
jgi:hypothetical protein